MTASVATGATYTQGSDAHQLDSSIEGLRAVAVLAVLFHHAFPRWLPGGFCGVDIFFVISGYLIGGKLIENARRGTLSFRRFYAARARRLLPALTLVLAATWAVGAWMMTAAEFGALGLHTLASAGFANNFLLASESGYFDAPAATKPLLHLWSLGIEEQFYLAAPLLVWFGWKSHRDGSVWVLRLGAASFLWTLWHWDLGRTASFFHPTFRFWEIAAGVGLAAWRLQCFRELSARRRLEWRAWSSAALLLALLQLGSRESGLGGTSVASLTGLAVVAAAAILLLSATGQSMVAGALPWHAGACGFGLIAVSLLAMPTELWPGPQTAVPVIGTLLLLASPAVHDRVPALRSRTAVAVGGISYPLYLWHWPALVFLQFTNPQPDAGEVTFVLVLSIVLGWLTKVFVESPARFGTLAGWKVRTPPAGLLFGLLLLAGGVGWVSHASGGLPQRFPPALREIATWSEPNAYEKWRLGECYFYLNEARPFAPGCSPAKIKTAPTVLLWGDSHAAHLYLGLADEAARTGFQLAQWTMGSCPPTLKALGRELPSCTARRAENWHNLRHYVPDVVILSGAWGQYLRGGASESELAEHIRATVAELQRLGVRQVLVFGNGQLWDTALPTGVYRYMARRLMNAVPARFGRAEEDLWSLDRTLELATQESGARYFSVLRALCDPAGCWILGNATGRRPDLLYWDRDHFTPSGARLVISEARPALLDSLASSPHSRDRNTGLRP